MNKLWFNKETIFRFAFGSLFNLLIPGHIHLSWHVAIVVLNLMSDYRKVDLFLSFILNDP